MSWCYHCNKDIKTTYMDGHLWTEHHTLMNTDSNVEVVKKEELRHQINRGLGDCLRCGLLGFVAVHVLFQKPKQWSLLTRAVAIGAGFYAIRKGMGVYEWFKKKKGG